MPSHQKHIDSINCDFGEDLNKTYINSIKNINFVMCDIIVKYHINYKFDRICCLEKLVDIAYSYKQWVSEIREISFSIDFIVKH
jgi:hypothetical protein